MSARERILIIRLLDKVMSSPEHAEALGIKAVEIGPGEILQESAFLAAESGVELYRFVRVPLSMTFGADCTG